MMLVQTTRTNNGEASRSIIKIRSRPTCEKLVKTLNTDFDTTNKIQPSKMSIIKVKASTLPIKKPMSAVSFRSSAMKGTIIHSSAGEKIVVKKTIRL